MINSITLGSKLPHLETYGKKKLARCEPLLNKTFKFKPGLNMLVGKNGSGKSSLLETLAQRLLCFNYGFPKIDSELYRSDDGVWIKDSEYSWHDPKFMPDVVLDYDQNPHGIYASPDFSPRGQAGRAYSMCYGLGQDATDFYDMTDTHSSGQGMQNVLDMVFLELITRKARLDRSAVKELEWRTDRCPMKKKADMLDLLMPQQGSPMVALLDEPERALDLDSQLKFWRDLVEFSQLPDTQIIIASHSVIPLFMQGADINYVEMTEGYADQLAYNAQALHA